MERKISSSKETILDAVYTLKEEGYKATLEGLTHLLLGNEEGNVLSSSAIFAYLPSLNSKKIKNRIHYLLQSGYLLLEYNSQYDAHFLFLSPKGKENRKLLHKKAQKKEETVLFLPIKK